MKRNNYWKILFAMAGGIIGLNVLGLIPGFCDFYADYIYIYINAFFGMLTSWCPFALGEIIMYLGAAAVVVQIVTWVLLAFLHERKGYVHFMRIYSKALLMTACVFLLLYTTNWFIPFKASVLQVSENERTSFTLEEVAFVRNMAVNELNRIVEEVERDEAGNLVFNYTEEDIKSAMKAMQGQYKRLAGFYPNSKENLCSPFLEWMGIGGYNYVYTMEPSYNKFVTSLYKPVLLAHELAHNKGYYKENEGEFLSCIALINSDNLLLQYSGYSEILAYIQDDFADALYDSLFDSDKPFTKEDMEILKAAYDQYPQLSKQFYIDYEYAQNQVDKLYEESVSPVLEETFSEVSAEVADVGWEIQGDILKENTYSGLSLMLLRYFVTSHSYANH